MEGDEEDYVFYGTPIEREEETSARKRKAIADAGQLRSLPAWKQEVRDEEGRRRFHGAFTGGFSAGYYNTVGSKEGWAPQTFTSSRKNRAEVKKQSVYNFLDEEDLKDMGGHALETSMKFDTFGFTAAEFARKQAEMEQEKRPSAIPGPVPDEIVIPASDSIGVKLLLKMGWRHGHSIKETHAESLYEARREARKAFLALSGNEEAESTRNEASMSQEYAERYKDVLNGSNSTPVYVLQPKQDLHGLGYDPYKHAPEFREKKRLRESGDKKHGNKTDISMRRNLLTSNSGKYAPGFGIGALEELDFEDEDIYAPGFEFEQSEVQEPEPSRLIRDRKYKLEDGKRTSLPGFKVASSSDYNLERFHPPVIPASFVPHHKFPIPFDPAAKITELPPPEVPPPEDSDLKLLIDGFATLVARCGKIFEDLSKEKNRSNPLFSFLFGGNGHNYYERKLWEAQQKSINQRRLPDDMPSKPSSQNMTAESRGKILGEKQLERSSMESISSVREIINLQSNLSDTFTKPKSAAGLLESVKPFKSDPAKQERFEQFLKDKYHGGLRSTQSSGSNTMSEIDRARERLDFEAAAEAIEKGKLKMDTVPPPAKQSVDFLGVGQQRFVSQASIEKNIITESKDKMADKIYPKREEFQWQPLPILCKRFDILDPFMGKPPPLRRPRSRMETLIFMTESIKNTKTEEADTVKSDSSLKSHSELEETEKQVDSKVPDIDKSSTSAQRPVDLYKAIFSDESEGEEDDPSLGGVDPVNKNEGANTALNRLVAGDFLETLGKELGLEVPSDPTHKTLKNSSFTPVAESTGDEKNCEANEKTTYELQVCKTLVENDERDPKQKFPVFISGGKFAETSEPAASPVNGDGRIFDSNWEQRLKSSRSSAAGGSLSDSQDYNIQAEKMEIHVRKNRSYLRRRRSTSPDTDSCDQQQSKKNRTGSRCQRRRSRSPSTDYSNDRYKVERSKTRSRHRRRTSSPDTGSSTDSPDDGHSRFRTEKGQSDRTSKRRLKNHKHKRKRSPVGYTSSEDGRRFGDDNVEDRKSGGKGKHSGHSRSGGHKKYR